MISYKELEKINVERAKARQYCLHCGHSILIPKKRGKRICNQCGHLVFKNKNEEFKYRLKMEIIKRKREQRNGRKDENLQ